MKINSDIPVGNRVVHRHPFISPEERLKNLSYTVPSEISQDISDSKNRIYTIVNESPSCAEIMPGIYSMHGGLFRTSTCIGVAPLNNDMTGLEKAIDSALSKLRSLFG